MTDEQRIELVRKESGCYDVYAITGFPGYFITKYGDVYSFKSKGVMEPGDTPRRLHTYRDAGNLMVRLSRPGCYHYRNVSVLYEHAKYGVDPTVHKPSEIQRLTRELAATQARLTEALRRLAELEGVRAS